MGSLTFLEITSIGLTQILRTNCTLTFVPSGSAQIQHRHPILPQLLVGLEPPLMPASLSEPAVLLVSVDPQEDEISLHDVDPVTGPSDAAGPITTR